MENVTADMRCNTCEHWQEVNAWDAEAGGLRRCARALPMWKIEDKIPREMQTKTYPPTDDAQSLVYKAAANKVFGEAKMVVNDGSQYYAELLTRPDFGCVLHKPIAG